MAEDDAFTASEFLGADFALAFAVVLSTIASAGNAEVPFGALSAVGLAAGFLAAALGDFVVVDALAPAVFTALPSAVAVFFEVEAALDLVLEVAIILDQKRKAA